MSGIDRESVERIIADAEADHAEMFSDATFTGERPDLDDCTVEIDIRTLRALAAAEELLSGAGICEIAARNPRVMEYMANWEGRAEAAEAREAKLREALRNIGATFPRLPSGLTDFGERHHYLHLACRLRDHARAALTDKGDTDNDG